MKLIYFGLLFLILLIIHTLFPVGFLKTSYGNKVGKKLFGKDIMDSVYENIED